MRFMVLVHSDPAFECGAMPSPEAFERMDLFNDEMIRAGILRAADGLEPTSKASRLRFDGTNRTVIDGPFTESKELIGGYWIIEVPSHEEALAWMRRAPFEDGSIEIRRIFGAEDVGADALLPETRERDRQHRAQLAQNADGPGSRFLVLGMLDEAATNPPSPEAFEQMDRFNDEMIKAGILVAAEGLTPTAEGTRIRFDGANRTLIDGPFSEAQEVVGGFSILRVADRETAIAWMKRAPLTSGMCEIRRIMMPEDFGSDALLPEMRERDVRHRAELAKHR